MIILDTGSEIPLYRQLSTQIMEAIVQGKLLTGETLPSVRSFAGDLGVNMHTVNKSYHELESKGIIEIVPKKGALIIGDKNQNVSEARRDILSEQFRPLVVEALVNGMDKKELHDVITNIVEKMEEE